MTHTGLGKVLCLGLQFYNREDKPGPAKGKKYIGQGLLGKSKHKAARSSGHRLHTLIYDYPPGKLTQASLSEFVGISLPKPDWLNHCPLDNSIASPPPLHRVGLMSPGSKPTLLITWWGFRPERPHPETTQGPAWCLISINSAAQRSHTWITKTLSFQKS